MLLRFDPMTSGAITVDDVDLERIDPEELPKVFASSARHRASSKRSIGENLRLGVDAPPDDAALVAMLGRSTSTSTVARTARAAASRPSSAAVPPNFSGGEQRRLMLAADAPAPTRRCWSSTSPSGLPSRDGRGDPERVAELAAGARRWVVTHAPTCSTRRSTSS